MALLTEQRLSAATRLLGVIEAAGEGKALLVQPTAAVVPARVRVCLTPVLTEQDWRDYEDQRVVVEAGVGVDAVRARTMVEALRERSRRLGWASIWPAAVNRSWERSGASGCHHHADSGLACKR